MGQPPSDQALRWSVTLLAEPSINRLASGTAGADPLVRVLITSDPSPVPILFRIQIVFKNHTKRALVWLVNIPVVGSDVELITSSTPKIFNRVILKRVAYLGRLPITKLWFVVNSVSMNGCLFFLAWFHLDRNRRSGGRCQWQMRWIRRSYWDIASKIFFINFPFFKLWSFMNSPWTWSWWVTVSWPYIFSTVQVYSPASSRVTSRTRRDPSGKRRIRSEAAYGVPLIFHWISGNGAPTAWHGSLTSSRYETLNVLSNDAILAGTRVPGAIVTVLEASPSPTFVEAVTQKLYRSFFFSPLAS